MSAGFMAAISLMNSQNQKIQQQEESSTPNIDSNFEYKIIRSNYCGFKDLNKTLKEESENGWELYETFDKSRIRLKRPISIRGSESKNGIDPYRAFIRNNDCLFRDLLYIMLFVVVYVLIGISIAYLSR